MAEYRIAVVEDEPLFSEQLGEYIQRYGQECGKKINIIFAKRYLA